MGLGGQEVNNPYSVLYSVHCLKKPHAVIYDGMIFRARLLCLMN